MNYTYQRAIPPRQLAALEFIRREIRRRGAFPSNLAIAEHMGWAEASARDCVLRLICLGVVVRERICCEDKRRRYAYSLPEAA